MTVAYTTQPGSATAPADYATTSGTLTFTAGQTTRPVTVPINGDTLDEDNETFTVLLSSPVNATIADDLALGTITDNDPLPLLSVTDPTVTEGNFGTVAATFTVSLNVPSGRALSVNYATADGTATAPADYAATSGMLSFAAGDTTKTVTVLVNGDSLDEANDTFFLNFTNPTNVTLVERPGRRHDHRRRRAAGSVGERRDRHSKARRARSPRRSRSRSQRRAAATSSSTTRPRTGRRRRRPTTSRRTAASRFAAGETTKTVTVPVNGDALDEIDETFALNLTSAPAATIIDSQGEGTITDNDELPALSVSDVTVTEGNTGTVNATFTVALAPIEWSHQSLSTTRPRTARRRPRPTTRLRAARSASPQARRRRR